MIRLVYISQTTKPFSTDELLDLLKECRRNNSINGLTGVLLYYDECFIQVLEGPEQTVQKVFNLIKKDPRHKNITELTRNFISERQFEDWSMGFEEIKEAQLSELNIPGLNHFFNPSADAAHNLEFKQSLLSSVMMFFRKSYEKRKGNEDLPIHDDQDRILVLFNKAIRFAVSILAFLMVLVIFWGVADVIFVIYEKLVISPPFLLMTMPDILATFGAFLAVLIAIEIFLNISLYLRSDVIPVKLVIATALMAISRKVIVFDFKNLQPDYIYASAAVVLSLGVTYWLIAKKE